ncbi:hypothetical protein MRX96_055682 [Rhipicephalus microplus]
MASRSAALEDTVIEQLSGSEKLIDGHRTAGIRIPLNVSFFEFADMNSGLEPCTIFADEEIIREVLVEFETTPTMPHLQQRSRHELS